VDEGIERVREGLQEGLRALKRRGRLLNEFKTFILRGNAVDLAVGVVIGAAFNTVIESLVKDVLTPIVSIPGKADFSKYAICLRRSAGSCSVSLRYGVLVTALISFLLTAAAVFFVVVRPINKLRERRRSGEPEAERTRDCPECLSKIPREASRCAFCTTKVGAAA
jgi:large conductance mechanosensitive channel